MLLEKQSLHVIMLQNVEMVRVANNRQPVQASRLV